MAKYLCGYCFNCRKITKQEVIHCEESPLERVGTALFTVGLSELLGDHDYECECTKCGHINSINH